MVPVSELQSNINTLVWISVFFSFCDIKLQKDNNILLGKKDNIMRNFFDAGGLSWKAILDDHDE